MVEKINIAELLKDCPYGMELDCTMFDNVTFVSVDNKRKQYPIEIAVGGLHSKYLTKEGCYHDNTQIPESKCVIFPKGKTTWEGFKMPFKDEWYNMDNVEWHNYVKIEDSKIFENLFKIINKYNNDLQQLNDDTYLKLKNEIETV